MCCSYTLSIEAVSCDELLVDCTELLSTTAAHPMLFAQALRNDILARTQCTASTGIGENQQG
jgi:DNA repair protein REV1